MVAIKTASVELLNSIHNNRDIYCIGCGKRLFEMIELYQDEPFADKIVGLFDNNNSLWGIEKQIGDNKLKIENPATLRKIKNAVLLITSDHYKEIYNSIKNYLESKNVIVYRYPIYYYRWTQILLKVLGCLPLKRQIVFCAGNEPHENADEIVMYLNKDYTGKKYCVVYLGECRSKKIDGVKYIQSDVVRCKSSFAKVFEYCTLYARAKFLCYENQALEKVNNRQCLIYLNHGTIPIKNVRDVLRQPDELDIGVCPGEGCANLYVEQYGIALEKQIYMMPARVNRMFRTEGAIHKLLEADGKKVVLWLPTFRQLKGSERKDSECINPIEILEKNIDEIEAHLSEKGMVIAIKKHPREKTELSFVNTMNNIYLLSDEQLSNDSLCLQDLMKDTDALITDYSGISFEYMLLDRPIGYVITDINEYHRGFSVANPEEYMPGEKIHNKEQLMSFIDNVSAGKDEFGSERRKLIEKLFGSNSYLNGAECFIEYLDHR